MNGRRADGGRRGADADADDADDNDADDKFY